ncbi:MULTISPECIES: hypothetical protein [Olivibacter]|uniref:Uncharacterized protein n=1 Tax=Olivibacter jilunii TaxID=985016 RepID=A0ABW6AW09_9SPHI
MEQNALIRNWGKVTLQSVKSRYISIIRGKNRSGDGLESLKVGYKSSFGEIDQINFKFARHLVFVHKGAGAGVGGAKGTSWVTSSGQRKRTAIESLNKLGTNFTKRRGKPWLNPVMDREVPKLADLLLELNIEHALKTIQIE